MLMSARRKARKRGSRNLSCFNLDDFRVPGCAGGKSYPQRLDSMRVANKSGLRSVLLFRCTCLVLLVLMMVLVLLLPSFRRGPNHTDITRATR